MVAEKKKGKQSAKAKQPKEVSNVSLFDLLLVQVYNTKLLVYSMLSILI